MKRLLISLLLVVSCDAQTAKPVRKPTVAERLDKLEAALQQTAKSRDDVAAENERLKKANTELVESNALLAKKLDELKAAAMDVYKYSTARDEAYKQLVDDHSSLIGKYNSVLSEANSELQRANARLARQNQISNALAIYGMMPRYTPAAPLQVYQPPAALQMNCTSSQVGTYTYTNCH